MTQNIRVSMIVWNDFQNDARVLKEAQTLQHAGYKVTIFALHTPSETQHHEVLACGVQIIRVSKNLFWFKRKELKNAVITKDKIQSPSLEIINFSKMTIQLALRTRTHLMLLLKLVQSKPAVIHAHDVNVLVTAWIASRIGKTKLVYDAHEVSTSREGYKKLRKVIALIERNLMPKTAANITTTETRAKYFSRAYRIPRPLILQNFTRLTESENKQKIRRTMCLRDNWPIVLYQGGIQQGRGLEKIIQAANFVPNTYFIFLGNGRLKQKLKNQVERLHLEHRVLFIDKVPLEVLMEYTASADIGIQALENTCFNHFSTDSNKIFEYIMAGLPVISSDFPEIRKIIQTYDLGILVPSGSTSSIAKALNKLLMDDNLMKRFKQNALGARSMFTWESQENKLVNLYETIIQPPK